MKYYFIAVNYNGFNFSRDYIDSIASVTVQNGDSIEVIIVDNNSTYGDCEKLSLYCSGFSFVKLIILKENIGYFKGLNKGIMEANKSKGTMLIVGNNDLTFDRDFLLNLKIINYEDDVLIIAPNIVTKDGRQQNPHVIKKVPLIQKIKSKIYYSNYYVGQSLKILNRIIRYVFQNKTKFTKNNYGQMKIKRGIGACYVMTPNFFKFFDKLDDRIFLWGEEALLSNQVESVSGSTLYDPTLKIIHHESASVSVLESKRRYDINKASYAIYKEYL